MREETKTLTFAASICIVVSLLLSGTAAGLKTRIEENEEFDIKRNIIKAFGVNTSTMKRSKIEECFEAHVTEQQVGTLPLFSWTDKGSKHPSKYAFPISGKGLWSMIYGYIALDAKLETIEGISFYKHGETPGLGAEIEKEWFLSQFVGKKLYKNETPTNFTVAKPDRQEDPLFEVDGISGATLTSKGVEVLIRKDANTYAEYFKTIRRK